MIWPFWPGEHSRPNLFSVQRKYSEAIAITIGVNAAAIVDLTDIAAENTGIRLFDGNGAGESGKTGG